MTDSAIDHELVASARVARELALEHCRHTVPRDCTWYHGVWQYFRALGVTKTAGGSAAFFGEHLQSLAAGGSARRVLISGAADDAMSLVVQSAVRDVGAALDLTIVDRCETPLALARWSARRNGVDLTTCRSDVLSLDGASAFDVIMTNSFLGAFHPAERSRLFARWANLLRRGGKLLITNRLRPGVGHEQLGFTAEQARVFCAAVRREAERAKSDLGLAPDILEGWARVYAERYRSYPVRSVDEVLELLRNAGFVADCVDTVRAAGRLGDRAISGPSVAERAEYVRLLATRP